MSKECPSIFGTPNYGKNKSELFDFGLEMVIGIEHCQTVRAPYIKVVNRIVVYTNSLCPELCISPGGRVENQPKTLGEVTSS